MTNVSISPKQEAVLNAAGDVARGIGHEFMLSFTAAGVSAFGYVDPKNHRSAMIHGGAHPTAGEAVATFLGKLNEERAKPPVFTEPAAVRDAVSGLLDEYRHKSEGDRTAFDPILDEIADRVAALPVK